MINLETKLTKIDIFAISIPISHIYIALHQAGYLRVLTTYYTEFLWVVFVMTGVLMYVLVVFRDRFDAAAVKEAEKKANRQIEWAKCRLQQSIDKERHEKEALESTMERNIQLAVEEAKKETLASMTEHPELHPVFKQRDNYAYHYQTIRNTCESLRQKTEQLEQSQTELKEIIQKHEREIHNKNQAINRLSQNKKKLRSQLNLH